MSITRNFSTPNISAVWSLTPMRWGPAVIFRTIIFYYNYSLKKLNYEPRPERKKIIKSHIQTYVISNGSPARHSFDADNTPGFFFCYRCKYWQKKKKNKTNGFQYVFVSFYVVYVWIWFFFFSKISNHDDDDDVINRIIIVYDESHVAYDRREYYDGIFVRENDVVQYRTVYRNKKIYTYVGDEGNRRE